MGPFSAGIIAAGDGARLREAYPDVPKPLLPIRGKPLIEWTASSLLSAGASEVVVLLNSRGRPVRDLLRRRFPDARWIFLEADTRSSWESFRLVSTTLAERSERFLVSTVDALIPPGEIARFWALAEPPALALTRFVDDEKPLWAELDGAGRVAALGPECKAREFVTCGLYAMSRPSANALPEPGAFARLREFWAAALRSGPGVMGVPLAKTVDVDRPEDVAAAEEFVDSLGARS